MSALGGSHDATLERFERAITELSTARYELTLFVSGASALSARAVADVRSLCDIHLHDRYELNIVDVHKDPAMVTSRGVLASPTLIKDHPLPRRVLVGDLSDTSRILIALDIEPALVQVPLPETT